MSSPGIVTLRTPLAPQRSVPDPAILERGKPRFTLWNYYSDPSEQFSVGVWAATRGCWRVRYTEHEFCHLLAGRVALTNEDGQNWEFSAGDSFVVPAGFSGTWDVLENCRKVYAIFEARRASPGA